MLKNQAVLNNTHKISPEDSQCETVRILQKVNLALSTFMYYTPMRECKNLLFIPCFIQSQSPSANSNKK